MRRSRVSALTVYALVLAGLVVTSSARPALAVGSQIRTFVAITGSDANPCTRTAPCRTFSAALGQTVSGGEIVALDSGGYGAVTIAQSVTVVAAPGVQASISPASGAAITVVAGANDTVVLRNLNLNGQGANYGVDYRSGGALHIENLTINHFFVYGIYLNGSGDRDVHVTDTVVRGSPGTGIYLYSLFGIARATIVSTRLEDNGNGILAVGSARAYVRGSVASGNSGYGFIAAGSDGSLAEIDLEDCMASRNGKGIGAGRASIDGSGLARVSNCVVTNNTTGILVNTGGSIYSRGNNTVEGNGTDGSFNGTYTAK